MKCPICQNNNTQVKDSRPSQNNTTIKRKRFCTKCKIKFTTLERIYTKNLTVIKRSGITKPFDRSKILHSVITAIRKRDISPEEVELIIDKIIHEIEESNIKEISTIEIGKIVMHHLKKVDLVAYVRFASVYKHFNNTQDFISFIKTIK